MTRSNRPDRITLDCPAKLNLTLAVGAPREDGLHPIASVMAAIDFADTLSIQRIDRGPSQLKRTVARDAPKPFEIDWPIEHDLLYRAGKAIEAQTQTELRYTCALTKRIPPGSGLGGGSSDAAAMLVGLRDLFELPITDDALVAIGLTLGSDVGFLVAAMLGHRAAVVDGVGDRITPIDALPKFHATLLFPAGGCETAAVYAAFDEQQAARSQDELDRLAASWQDLRSLPTPFNDLERPACEVCQAIPLAKSTLSSLDQTIYLSGSGSTLYTLSESRDKADSVASAAKGLDVYAQAASMIPKRGPRNFA